MLHEFFSTFESNIDAGALATGCLVAGKTSLADCALCNWVTSFYNIANLNVSSRFPKVWAFSRKQIEVSLPPGAKDHYDGFSMFGKFVHLASFGQLGMFLFCTKSRH